MTICHLSDTSSSSSSQTSLIICRELGRGSWFSNLASATSSVSWPAAIMAGIQDISNITYLLNTYFYFLHPEVFMNTQKKNKLCVVRWYRILFWGNVNQVSLKFDNSHIWMYKRCYKVIPEFPDILRRCPLSNVVLLSSLQYDVVSVSSVVVLTVPSVPSGWPSLHTGLDTSSSSSSHWFYCFRPDLGIIHLTAPSLASLLFPVTSLHLSLSHTSQLQNKHYLQYYTVVVIV